MFVVPLLFCLVLLKHTNAKLSSRDDTIFLEKDNSYYTDYEASILLAKTRKLECEIAKSYNLSCPDLSNESILYGDDVIHDRYDVDQRIAAIQSNGASQRFRRTMLWRPSWLWDTISLPYEFDHSLIANPSAHKRIQQAFEIFHENTCISFRNRSSQDLAYIIIKAEGFWCSALSTPQRDPSGRFPAHWIITLAEERCYSQVGTAWHELAHVIGKHHEHMREDRDSYVLLYPENIKQGKLRQFAPACRAPLCFIPNTPYDFGSVMHYPIQNKFRKNDKDNLLPRDQMFLNTMGSRLPGPTFYDIKSVNTAYGCRQPTSCQSIGTFCHRGGYAHPKRCGHCLCPEGFTGQSCESIDTGYPNTCGGELKANGTWLHLKTPFFPELRLQSQKCTWLIKTDSGRRIVLRFEPSAFGLSKVEEDRCDRTFVELRYGYDLANTGARFCGDTAPNGTYYSNSNQVLVLLRSYEDSQSYKGFTLYYQMV